jgi:uncharacterized coiled-coil protein SlyX
MVFDVKKKELEAETAVMEVILEGISSNIPDEEQLIAITAQWERLKSLIKKILPSLPSIDHPYSE